MKKEKYNVYLDDCRETPDGFDIRTYTYEDTIQVLEKMEGHIGVLSLDNDLGTEKEGRHVMLWMEEKFYTDNLIPYGYTKNFKLAYVTGYLSDKPELYKAIRRYFDTYGRIKNGIEC